ncbi:MAG: N-acetyl-gamma-glutamyl-phosphate reductase [Ruminococcaceae bacterium]|nr:N-acetyl-gamma-glutamyl-phosphate reductase [Oscillospiraceae bacterium]
MTKIFIDGREGTTGLRIYDRLASREDIELIILKEEDRKNPEKRKEAINSSDISFLCLPDAAAIEAEEMCENPNTVIIDTSTAHRTTPGWAYGFPEIDAEHLQQIKESKRIAVPGCHASGYVALVYPLVKAGILSADSLLTCHSITGYSGGGKKMIAEYQSEDRSELLGAPRQYGLSQQHKHLKEMKALTGIAPIFSPIVSDFYSGMVMTVPVFKEQLTKGKTMQDIKDVYKNLYTSEIVMYSEDITDLNAGAMISGSGMARKDSMRISVLGNEDRILLVAQYDNLGKGASGAAIQCLNIKMGADEKKGLDL